MLNVGALCLVKWATVTSVLPNKKMTPGISLKNLTYITLLVLTSHMLLDT